MKHIRFLGYGAIGLTFIAVGVAFVKPISSSNLLIRARADMGNLSVTFSRSTCTNSKGSYNNSDYVLTTGLQQSGLSVQASLTNGNAITSGQDVVRFNGNSSTLIFSIPSNVAGVTNFRKIKSLSFVYNGTYNVGNNYFDVIFSASSDFSSPDTINVENDASATPNIGNAHYVKMIGDKSHYAYFASIVIHYSCSDEPEVKTLSSISVSGAKTEFTVGDAFSFGGTVTAHYSDSSSADVTNSATFSGYNMSQTGEQTVTVSYTEDAITKEVAYDITVADAGGATVADNLVSHGTFNMTCTQSSQIIGKLTFNTLSTGVIFIQNTNTFTAWTETQTFNWSISDNSVTVSFTNITAPSLSTHAHLESTNKLTVTFDANNLVTALSLPLTNSFARTLVYSA